MKNKILNLFNRATAQTVKDGINWYPNANEFLELTSFKTGFSIRKLSNALSTLSPACSWDVNKRDLNNLAVGVLQGIESRIKVSTYGQFKQKAIDLLKGEIDFLETKTNQKTFNFKENLFEPLNPNFVTIDRHAWKAYKGLKDGGSVRLTKKQYIECANVYKKTAHFLGLVPSQLQAIVWIQYKLEVGR